MSRLFLQMSVSLDGYIEDATGNIDWMVFDASVDPFATHRRPVGGCHGRAGR